jgi:hypothetical protein
MRSIRFAFAAIMFVVGALSTMAHGVDNAVAATFGKQSLAHKGTQIRLTRHKVVDKNGTGKLAGIYLLPDGFTATDSIKWMPNDYLIPVVGTSTLKNKDESVIMEWMSGMQTNFGHGPAGSFGTDPPESVCAFLLSLWIREHEGVDVTVVSRQDSNIPESTQTGAGFKTIGKRGVLKLQYRENGVTYLAKSSARVDVMMTIPAATAIGGAMYEGGWVISNAYDVSAPSDKLPGAMKLFAIVLASYRTDPHFFNTVAQARDIIQKNFYGQLGVIMETSKIISQTNDEISASIHSQYQTASAASDHEAANFDDYIRDIDRYQEPDGPIGLPSGYAHAWSDGNGKYIVTDQHLYDPNVNGPGGTWSELHKAR